MKYLITHLHIPNPILGTAWETIDPPMPLFKTEIIEGIIEINQNSVSIFQYQNSKSAAAIGDYSSYKEIIFVASLQNVTISLIQ